MKEELVGEKVVLRKLVHSYIEDTHIMLSPKVRQILELQNLTFEDSRKIFEERIKAMEEGRIIYYIIFNNKDNRVIGAIEVREVGYERGQLGNWINEGYWGTGMYQEALKLISNEYFSWSNENEYNAFVKKDNLRSYNVLKKFGFVEKEDIIIDDVKFYNLVLSK